MRPGAPVASRPSGINAEYHAPRMRRALSTTSTAYFMLVASGAGRSKHKSGGHYAVRLIFSMDDDTIMAASHIIVGIKTVGARRMPAYRPSAGLTRRRMVVRLVV